MLNFQDIKDFTLCETIAASSWHIRKLKNGEEANYNGFTGRQPFTLCRSKSAWDIRVQISPRMMKDRGVCSSCKEAFKEMNQNDI